MSCLRKASDISAGGVACELSKLGDRVDCWEGECREVLGEPVHDLLVIQSSCCVTGVVCCMHFVLSRSVGGPMKCGEKVSSG